MHTHRSMPILLLTALLVSLWPLAPVTAQTANCAQTVTVQAGDTLSTIAGRTLGDASAYARIVAATNAAAAVDTTFAVIESADRLRIGWKLCIPGAQQNAAPAASTPSATEAPASTSEDGGGLVATDPFDGEALTIDYLRQQNYPDQQLVIEETLAPGVNYNRYIASYRSEGLRINGLLTVPQGEAPATGWPVIIFNHGYIPPSVYRPTERYVAYVDGFARNGYIVFRPDYRGHAFSEGEARGAYGYPDYTIDVLNATAALKNHPAADANRIGMWGHSMGGYITLRAMVTDPDIKAGVIWAGVVANYPDLLTKWRRSNNTPAPAVTAQARRWRTLLQEQYGAPEDNPAFYASISANSYLADLSGPLQLHHGTADTSVPYEFSTTLRDQLLAAGQVGELYTYAGDDHNISQGFSEAMARSLAFFDQHVKNAE
ncbi:MAG TPA: peptidase [Chloroflexi bacterium]|nr:peptidase [Chloroflexota bacterium]HHW87611.1 alpha/beta fold hydrolase [Chloroflexota bacterium]